MILTRDRLASMIDYALVKPTHTVADLKDAAKLARENGIGALCVLPVMVSQAAELLKGSRVKVCSVVDFPLGSSPTRVRVFQAEKAVEDGAHELDAVISLPLLKSQLYERVRLDLETLVESAKRRGLELGRNVVVKIIIETGYLTVDEMSIASRLVEEAGADYVKTCTGFGPRGATLKDVSTIKSATSRVKIKAAGGISTFERAVEFIRAGAERIGASRVLDILNGWKPVEV